MSVEQRKSTIIRAMNNCQVPPDLINIFEANFDMAVNEAKKKGRQEKEKEIVEYLDQKFSVDVAA